MTFFERLSFIVKHAGSVYVRAKVDSKWESVALCDLDEMALIVELHRLAKRDVEPTRVVE